jgi:hypothetical protein
MGTNPFTDVPQWGIAYVAYAHDIGLANGVGRGLFDPESHITYHQFTAFLLRALGYSEKLGDFEYVNTLKFALSIGLYTGADNSLLAKGPFLREYAVIAMVRALCSNIKGSNNLTLLDVLVDSGVISEEQANIFTLAIAKIDKAQ